MLVQRTEAYGKVNKNRVKVMFLITIFLLEKMSVNDGRLRSDIRTNEAFVEGQGSLVLISDKKSLLTFETRKQMRTLLLAGRHFAVC